MTTLKSISIPLLLGASFFLSACGSKVPLTEPAPVEVRTGSSSTVPSTDAAANPVQTRDVKRVDVMPAVVEGAGTTVYFDFDSYVIKPQFQTVIEVQAKRLAANRATKMTLAGHTDELGGREYNLALGQKRAEAVKRALILLGGTEAQLEAVSYGKEKPAMQGGGDAAGEKNRRVEVAVR